jgi:hypothetical protein
MSVTIAAKISPWRLEGAAKISAALLPPRYSSARGARSTTAEATDTNLEARRDAVLRWGTHSESAGLDGAERG